ncbi:MAG: RiPP maturation radical SAM C-methyltransferase [Candidatus Hodarchaeota archaeon]
MQQSKSILLLSMPFPVITIPSIQLQILENYLDERNINVKSRHLYLKAADFYGLTDYNYLTYPPNDSYNAQLFYSRFVFPQHWEENKEKIKEFFYKRILHETTDNFKLSYEKYSENTNRFLNWALGNVEWKEYDIIGFSLNYGQLLPSLAFAKKIKEIDPNKKIIFGGSRVVDEIGINILESIEYIDFIISGDGEDSLYQLVTDYENYKNIPRLIYRDGEKVKFNKAENTLDLNILPTPDFSSFFIELENCGGEIQQNFHLNGKIPIEISRGCWWNKCSFCNLNVQHYSYREKNIDKVIDEIKYISDKYRILSFQLIANTLFKTNYRYFLNKIIDLNKDFNFFVETRAGYLKSEDYQLLKKAGFITIQTGIETFSQNYMKKMNKGAKIIDNIATLKYCKENLISNSYNIIINFPNEEDIDYKESKKNIESIKYYIDPPNISPLFIGFKSPIFCNFEDWNIKEFDYIENDKVIFPKEILQKNISFFYSFKTKNEVKKHDWKGLIDNWTNIHKSFLLEKTKKQNELDKLIFYYLDGNNFIKTYDKRNPNSYNIFILDETEREIFLSCINKISYDKLSEKLSQIPDFKLASILRTFEKSGIVFVEDNFYLSLPLDYKKILRIKSEKKEEYDNNLIKDDVVK